MHKHKVYNEKSALLYLLDCNLATVSSMAMLKSRSQYEYKRHIEIAQINLDWIRVFSIDLEPNSRGQEVAENEWDVAKWAKSFEVEKSGKKKKT